MGFPIVLGFIMYKLFFYASALLFPIHNESDIVYVILQHAGILSCLELDKGRE